MPLEIYLFSTINIPHYVLPIIYTSFETPVVKKYGLNNFYYVKWFIELNKSMRTRGGFLVRVLDSETGVPLDYYNNSNKLLKNYSNNYNE